MNAPAGTNAVAMTIAGSDSSGGAGIQADLKTFTAFGVYGASVLTALTAQNTRGVDAVHAVPPDFVARQLQSVVSDLTVGAVKTGMLANAQIINAVVAGLAAAPVMPVVVDPVMVATSGDSLLEESAVEAMRTALFPRATLITPNLPEAAKLLGLSIAQGEADSLRQLDKLARLGAKAVLLKGGHGDGEDAVDYFWMDGSVTKLAAPRIASRNTHGTGCTLSAAIAALLARGETLPSAVRRAKTFVHRAIIAAKDMQLGSGHGPVDHLFAIRQAPLPS